MRHTQAIFRGELIEKTVHLGERLTKFLFAVGFMGYCRHKIFGRGKIIATLDDGKVRVNFPNFGPKVILAAYLELEDAS